MHWSDLKGCMKVLLLSVPFRSKNFDAFCHFAMHSVCCMRCPASVVRRPSSVVRRPLDNFHFQLLLQNRLMDFDETYYGWITQGPLQVLLFFGQISPGADPGWGQIRSRGSPSSKNFFFRQKGYSNKPNAKQWSRSIWEEKLLFLVSFESQIFDAFLTSFWISSFWCILMQFL